MGLFDLDIKWNSTFQFLFDVNAHMDGQQMAFPGAARSRKKQTTDFSRFKVQNHIGTQPWTLD
jgi:hypothetical protein